MSKLLIYIRTIRITGLAGSRYALRLHIYPLLWQDRFVIQRWTNQFHMKSWLSIVLANKSVRWIEQWIYILLHTTTHLHRLGTVPCQDQRIVRKTFHRG